MTTPVYLDYNATTPVDPRVLAALLPYLSTHFGNPSSNNAYGREARDAVAAARSQVGGLIGAPAQAITFAGSRFGVQLARDHGQRARERRQPPS